LFYRCPWGITGSFGSKGKEPFRKNLVGGKKEKVTTGAEFKLKAAWPNIIKKRGGAKEGTIISKKMPSKGKN